MTTDYPVPTEKTFAIPCRRSTGVTVRIADTVAWLRTDEADEYRL
jgi:hypothetical protein